MGDASGLLEVDSDLGDLEKPEEKSKEKKPAIKKAIKKTTKKKLAVK